MTRKLKHWAIEKPCFPGFQKALTGFGCIYGQNKCFDFRENPVINYLHPFETHITIGRCERKEQFRKLTQAK